MIAEICVPLPITTEMFFAALYGGTARSGYIELRIFGAKAKLCNRLWVPVRDGQVQEIPTIPTGRNVYYGVALRQDVGSWPGVGGRKNCLTTDIVHIDLDLKAAELVGSPGAAVHGMAPTELRERVAVLARAALDKCRELDLIPVACVYTGHGIQILWRAPAPVSHEQTMAYNRAVGAMFGSAYGYDRSTCDVPRVLRLLNTQNIKNPERPIDTEVWLFQPEARADPAILDALVPPTAPRAAAADRSVDVIATFNQRYGIEQLLQKYGYRRESADRYTRPGEDASGNDVQLVEDSRGVLCSVHYSSNDIAVETPGDHRPKDPFALFRFLEHGGDTEAAIRAAAVMLGMDRRGKGERNGLSEDESGTADHDEETTRPPIATRVVEYVLEIGGELWRGQDGQAYLTVAPSEGGANYRLPSRPAREYVQLLYYKREHRSLGAQAQAEALSLLQTLGRAEGPEYVTGLRVVHLMGCTYLDLGDVTWDVVVVSPEGWRIVPASECPVRFVRASGTLPIPRPVHGGSLRELGDFLNTDATGLIMCTSWLLAATSGLGPYPLLALGGEEGTGKSTAGSVLRRLMDPYRADRRRTPRDERDLYIAAQAHHAFLFDNLSSIPDWLSDALCGLSTGAASTARTLYSDDEETILEAKRPVIVNGIPDLLTRPDLAERSLTVTLKRISPAERVPEMLFWARYEEARPRVLGALLTALSGGLRRLPDTHLPVAPRLADFARLIVSAEPYLPWSAGDFMQAYAAMQTDAAATLLDDEPVAEGVRRLLDNAKEWSGTVKELLSLLGEQFEPPVRPPKNWPQTPKALGVSLRRLAAALGKLGYQVTPLGRTKAGLMYRLHKPQPGTAVGRSGEGV